MAPASPPESYEEDDSLVKLPLISNNRVMSSSPRRHSDERTSLLPQYPSDQLPNPLKLPRKPLIRSRKAILALIATITALATISDKLQDSPNTRIYESIFCYRYYEKHDPGQIRLGRDAVGPGAIGGVPEMLCKVDDVQSDLAMLEGYQNLLNGIPALLLAIPFAWAADRFGRRPIFLLCLLGYIVKGVIIQGVTWWWQLFDIRMVWMSTLYAIFGGGDTVVSSLFYVIISDMAPSSERTNYFFHIGAAEMAASLGGPFLAAWLMDYTPWIPTLIGTVVAVFTFVLAFTLTPETKGFRDSTSNPPTPPQEPLPPTTPASAHIPDPLAVAGSSINRNFVRIKNATRFLTNDWRIPALIITYAGHNIVANASGPLLQYCSKRYNMDLGHATILTSVFTGAKFVLLLTILPYITKATKRKFNLTEQQKDLYLSRAAFAVLTLGWTMIGLSPNLPVVAISMCIAAVGSAPAYFLSRSFLTSLIPVHHIARVYSTIAIIDTLGAMSGSMLLAGLFTEGISLGGAWLGMPFLFLGVVGALSALIMVLIPLRRATDPPRFMDETTGLES